MLVIDVCSVSCEIALMCMSQGLIDDTSTIVKVVQCSTQSFQDFIRMNIAYSNTSNALVLSRNKLLPEPNLTHIFVAITGMFSPQWVNLIEFCLLFSRTDTFLWHVS